ncbi:hypothetical protein B0H13DRAFT_2356572 [Mycena leptocephala]|nr:hypothetical protein B0H13DRAFT_2356572 [Mycena leptocephala]
MSPPTPQSSICDHDYVHANPLYMPMMPTARPPAPTPNLPTSSHAPTSDLRPVLCTLTNLPAYPPTYNPAPMPDINPSVAQPSPFFAAYVPAVVCAGIHQFRPAFFFPPRQSISSSSPALRLQLPTFRPLHPVYQQNIPSLPPIHPRQFLTRARSSGSRIPALPSAESVLCCVIRIPQDLSHKPLLVNPLFLCQPWAKILTRPRPIAKLAPILHISSVQILPYTIRASGACPTASRPRVSTESVSVNPAVS